MVDYKKKYQKIIDELIGESFPELRGKRIWVSEMNSEGGCKFSAATYYFFWFSLVRVSLRLREFSSGEIKGVLAHELGHVFRFESCSFFGKLWKGFRYFSFRKFRMIEENACDRIAIERGYGKGLALYKTKKKKGKYSDCYLSAKEVKKYAKEIEKW